MKLKYDQNKNIVYIKLSGALTEKFILDAFDAAVDSNEYKPGMGRLWDFGDADLSSLETKTIERMAQYSIKFPAGVNDVKVSFVTGRDLEYGLSRMFAGFSNKANTRIMVFHNMDEAETWMMEPSIN